MRAAIEGAEPGVIVMGIPFQPDELRAALLAADRAADPAAVRVIRAPGRVNLIGEHTDYNLGFVLPAAIDREVRMAVVATGDRRVELTRLDTGERAGFDLDDGRPRDGSWLDYIAGTAWALAEAGYATTGLRGVIASDLPENAGLSSSAAVELAAAWALLGAAATEVDPLALARICQRGENGYVGVRSGLMDQFASSCGAADHALLLDCRSFDWRAVALPADLRLVVLHSGSSRKLDGSAYNERRSQCEAAVATLALVDPGIRSLRDVTPGLLAAERYRLDAVVARRAEHIVAENERVIAVIDALDASDLVAVGQLFAAGHRSLRDLFEISSPELDALVELADGVDGVVAARMTGGGFGGCTVNLVRPDAVETLAAVVEAEYPARTGLMPTVLRVHAADGAGYLA
ncbi:MAG: galactokinase [Chloroflexi bacterium]|nr:galactokinase [Chloroflexota bacterium]